VIRQNTIIRLCLVAAVFVAYFGFNCVQLRRHAVVVESRTPQWSSEADAACQGTIKPGLGIPIFMLEATEALPVRSYEYGKDYWAIEVESKSGQTS